MWGLGYNTMSPNRQGHVRLCGRRLDSSRTGVDQCKEKNNVSSASGHLATLRVSVQSPTRLESACTHAPECKERYILLYVGLH
jgi:hypothetical protein